MLVGVAIGDAVGAGVEMKNRDEICDMCKSENNNSNPLRGYADFRINSYAINYWPGRYTDDAEHSLVVLKFLQKKLLSTANNTTSSKQDFEAQLDELICLFEEEWFQQTNKWKQLYFNIFGKLFGTIRNVSFSELIYASFNEGRQGHGSILRYFRKSNDIESIRLSQKSKKRPGNAPVMRACPLGLISDVQQRWHFARVIADCTHPHELARDAAFVVGSAAHFFACSTRDSSQLIAYCLRQLEAVGRASGAVAKHLRLVDNLDDYHEFNGIENAQLKELLDGDKPFGRNKNIVGLPVDSMLTATTALYILKHAHTVGDALRSSLCVGGDVDSLAATCLGCLCSRRGVLEIPRVYLDQLERLENVVATGEAFFRQMSMT